VSRVSDEVGQVFGAARATLGALHTVLAERVIEATDPAKREFLFLAHLQAHRHLTWVSVGFEDGVLFGARRAPDGEIQMVEANRVTADEFQLRIDHYTPDEEDIYFQRRTVEPTNERATLLPWYPLARSAPVDSAAQWTGIHALPVDGRPGLSAAVPLHIFEQFVAVLSVSVGLDNLDEFLRELKVGQSGTVFILNSRGDLVAAPERARAALKEHKALLGDSATSMALCVGLGQPGTIH
jgi:adenylate cyclase